MERDPGTSPGVCAVTANRAAPPLDCAVCARTIGKRAGHHLTEDRRILCTRCIHRQEVHARLWPGCAHVWHDALDHTPTVAGTRAAIARILGLWPSPPAHRPERATFGEWLHSRRDEPTAVGDLARDVAADVAMGCLADTSTPEAVAVHLFACHDPAPAALVTLDAAALSWGPSR